MFTNTGGSATGTAATLTVSTPPAVSQQPSDRSVLAGQTASFTAAASGTPTPTVQWQVSTDGGTSFTNLAGATSPTLSFTAAQTQSGNRYRAVFTNSAGPATTSAATLTVSTPPSITQQPTNRTVVAGQSASFTAAASGTPTPTVQWQVSTNGGATFTNVSGATSTTYAFTVFYSQTGNQYRAVFTSSAGTATTNAALLTVTDHTPPVFAQHANVVVPATTLAGAVVTYSVSAPDPDDTSSTVTIVCTPPSGSTFALGAKGATKATTVTCNAHDLAGNQATPMSFTITVLGGDGQITALKGVVSAATAIPSALRSSLNKQLTDADNELTTANASPATTAFDHYINALYDLDAFVQQVSDNTARTGQTTKPITPTPLPA